MKVLVTGAGGQLGKEIVKQCREKSLAVEGKSHYDLNICDKSQVKEVFRIFHPDIVINCAAYNAVDKCEEEDNYKEAYAINAEGTKILSKMCEQYEAKFVHISTDYVFSEKNSPIYESEQPEPIGMVIQKC